jgi:6,7-dimethyl-8-ribityllumazine synthase
MGVQINQINIIDKIVPGSFELPIIAKYLAESEKVHAVICLGVVIRGDTPHFDFVCENCSRGIMDVSLKTNVPIIFGVLCCNTIKQAEERALPPSDLPRSLAITTITMAAQRKSLLEKTFV